MITAPLPRTFRVAELLLLDGLKSAQVADRLGVSRKTIDRDVDRLLEYGIPVQFDCKTNTWQLGRATAVPKWFQIFRKLFDRVTAP